MMGAFAVNVSSVFKLYFINLQNQKYDLEIQKTQKGQFGEESLLLRKLFLYIV